MKRMNSILLCVVVALSSFVCWAQDSLPDAPAPRPAKNPSLLSPYTPPTQGELFHGYITNTFGLTSVLEAGVRGGIQQANDSPDGWPQGGQGYADRFGSAIGQIAIRGTTEYVFADLFKEDLRFRPCETKCNKFSAAVKDTFLARKGGDGHEAFSVARLVGPWSGSAVAVETWYPSVDKSTGRIVQQALFNYGFQIARNYIRELRGH
jgi:hypothetical protein